MKLLNPFYSRFSIRHSAKGSEWEEHKYIKKIDGNYYYPDSYEGGRHLDNNEKRIDSSSEMSSETIDQMAKDVIRGLFGDGTVRKELLGDAYEKIQNRVNEILKSSNVSSEKIDDLKGSDVERIGNSLLSNTVNKLKKKNTSMDQIYSVYAKKNGRK